MCINYLVQQSRNNRDVWPTLGTGSLPHPPRPNETLLYPQCSCSPILCQHCTRSGPGPRDTATAAQCRSLMVTCRARSPRQNCCRCAPTHRRWLASVYRLEAIEECRSASHPSGGRTDLLGRGWPTALSSLFRQRLVSAGDFSTFIGHILKFLYLCFFIYLKNDYFPRAAQGKSGKCNRVDRQKDSKKASFRIWVEKQCSRDTKNHIVFLELACF